MPDYSFKDNQLLQVPQIINGLKLEGTAVCIIQGDGAWAMLPHVTTLILTDVSITLKAKVKYMSECYICTIKGVAYDSS